MYWLTRKIYKNAFTKILSCSKYLLFSKFPICEFSTNYLTRFQQYIFQKPFVSSNISEVKNYKCRYWTKRDWNELCTWKLSIFQVQNFVGPRHTQNPCTLRLQTPQKDHFFFGGGLCHQIFFSILKIRYWFKIWKILKISFWSICNILINTKIFDWELNLKISENDQKVHVFWNQKIFKSYKQNLGVISMDNVFKKSQQFFMSNFLH